MPARGPKVFGMSDHCPCFGRGWNRTLTRQGWDPIFEFDGETFAEMDKQKKNTLSHRAIALGKLKNWLLERQ